jgi:iron complex outermembrane recepter protein
MRRAALILTLALAAPAAVHGQQPASTAAVPPLNQNDQDPLRISLPVVTVTADKEPEVAQTSPVSVTAVTRETIEQADPHSVSDAAVSAPNTWFTEFTARKLSDARFRGIGSSPNNPGITTYIDGVPQLNANSSSIELADIDQIEFVRGPQSALYGRDSIGGLINITSVRPSLNDWTGSLISPFGNFGAADVRGSVSGPLMAGKLGLGVAVGYSARDGYTTNDLTGHNVDSRSAFFSKSQLLFTPAPSWEARAIVTTERARDGDYALNDLDAVRANPFHVQRGFEGFTNRDIVAPTLLLRRTGKTIDFSTITGLVWWKTDDSTDLDYSPRSLVTRTNAEKDTQFTQEVRLASGKDAALPLSTNVALSWQTGVFLFTQRYNQDAVNNYAPFVLSQYVNFPVSQTSPQSSLDDDGVGVYGRGTFTFHGNLEGIVGLRGDYENKKAALNTFFSPTIAPPTAVNAQKSFTDVSPQFTVAYHFLPAKQMVYVTAARGFKAGGFNAASPVGSESYGEEHTWNYEAGAKTLLARDRLSVDADVFYMQWDSLQVNLPNPAVLGQFFIANAGGATSKGVELAFNARLLEGCDFFAGLGYTDARFDAGSVSNGVAVGGNRISNTPKYTADFGGQYSVAVSSRAHAYARAEFVFRGDFKYDDANTQGQAAYSIANFRAGVRGKLLFGEAWIRNAFDTRYIPLAFAFPTPSGFLGEPGAPRTFGLRAGLTF